MWVGCHRMVWLGFESRRLPSWPLDRRTRFSKAVSDGSKRRNRLRDEGIAETPTQRFFGYSQWAGVGFCRWDR